MSKIKFKLVSFEKALVFQILEMDERFRAVWDGGSSTNTYEASNGVIIHSHLAIEITTDRDVYLRGESVKRDFDIVIKHFENNKKRDKVKEDILFALKEWAEKWEGWDITKSPVKEDTDTEDIFEF